MGPPKIWVRSVYESLKLGQVPVYIATLPYIGLKMA